ncbi:sulfite reductase [Chryseobacterium soli]|uniref:assimilatory sulfite reductase (NADPH) n=1 Tax=Chryseobacterium soli TaxID=445961 RepID=A0A085ZYZ9_9FLAO|nr:flavodoxin domain-containing protein [Chryseobacterium soli]KFF09663.1 sulfite reductase [Chryseobacterium soli]
MLSDLQLQSLKKILGGFTQQELIWTNGYIAGLLAESPSAIDQKPTVITKPRKITLAFGTETGNAKRLATHLAASAKKQGVQVKLTGADQYRITDLPKEEYFFLIISTQGDGEPPILAKKFYDYILNNTLDLSKVHFGILGLGDSSYPEFCKTAEDLQIRFMELGGKEFYPVQKCDTDYQSDAENWFDGVINKLSNETLSSDNLQKIKPNSSSKKYFQGTVVSKINLNDIGSNKETYHIEIITEDEIDYEPGDALGVIPFNTIQTVHEILNLVKFDSNTIITTERVTAPTEELLKHHLNISYLLKSTVKKYAALTGHSISEERLGLLDLLKKYPSNVDFEKIIGILTPQAPRLYSVSSSPNGHGTTEIHVTVSKNRFTTENDEKIGVCSEYLSELDLNQTVEFYIQKAKHFKLPDENKDIIMIGPGTGIAPFRSFITERDAVGATGKNWLFFGEQHFISDFLYQTEIQSFLQTGSITNLDLAFSRDQHKKVYVQDRLKEKSTEIFEWLENGAHLYVCGTRDPMYHDVENTLLEILEDNGKTREQARQYLDELEEEERFAKDVY